MWVLIHATSLFNSLCKLFVAMLQDKLHVFCGPFFSTFATSTIISLQSFQFKDILESIVPKLSRL